MNVWLDELSDCMYAIKICNVQNFRILFIVKFLQNY